MLRSTYIGRSVRPSVGPSVVRWLKARRFIYLLKVLDSRHFHWTIYPFSCSRVLTQGTSMEQSSHLYAQEPWLKALPSDEDSDSECLEIGMFVLGHSPVHFLVHLFTRAAHFFTTNKLLASLARSTRTHSFARLLTCYQARGTVEYFHVIVLNLCAIRSSADPRIPRQHGHRAVPPADFGTLLCLWRALIRFSPGSHASHA